MPETHFDGWVAQHYATLWPELFDPAVLNPTVECLAELANGGPALELGIGTGRVALPLARRGITTHGIELSEAMIAQLKTQPGGNDIEVTQGDFATTKLNQKFQLIYLLRNTITNLTTQEEQVECFRNAAAHLQPGGRFVIENYIPALQQLPQGETARIVTRTPTHIAVEDYDLANQIAVTHHYWIIDGEPKTFESPHRYLWPAELDLMAKIAGLTSQNRWTDWHKTPYTSQSKNHISVWQKQRASSSNDPTTPPPRAPREEDAA